MKVSSSLVIVVSIAMVIGIIIVAVAVKKMKGSLFLI